MYFVLWHVHFILSLHCTMCTLYNDVYVVFLCVHCTCIIKYTLYYKAYIVLICVHCTSILMCTLYYVYIYYYLYIVLLCTLYYVYIYYYVYIVLCVHCIIMCALYYKVYIVLLCVPCTLYYCKLHCHFYSCLY